MDSKKRERVTIGRIWGLIYPMLLYLGVTFAVEFIFMIAVQCWVFPGMELLIRHNYMTLL